MSRREMFSRSKSKVVDDSLYKPKSVDEGDCSNCGDPIFRTKYSGIAFHRNTQVMVCTDAKRHVLIDTAGFTMFAKKG